MMLGGLDENEKKIKNAMLAAGADNSFVKGWFKVYEKTKKNSTSVAGRYYRVKEELTKLLGDLEDLEQMIIGYNELTEDEKNKFLDDVKDMKSMQGDFDSEFLISKADRDFHTTLQSVLSLSPDYVSEHKNGVILHSEIENLIALTKEGLGREKPDLFALAFFYQGWSNNDLLELSFPDKVGKVMRIYHSEFIFDMQKCLASCIKQADAIADKFEGTSNKKAARLLSDVTPLLEERETDSSPNARAEQILKTLCCI